MQGLLRALETSAGPRPQDALQVNNLAKELALEVAKLLGLDSGTQSMQPPNGADRKLVFVVMSFQLDMEPVFEGVQAAAEAVGLYAKRVKDVQGDYRITDKILQMIHAARLIVVDLTHERPNVYFELGYARGLGKTVVTTVRAGGIVHFDVKDWNYIEYNDSRILERDLKKRFEFELSV